MLLKSVEEVNEALESRCSKVKVGCRRRSAANKNRVPRTISEEGGPIPLHRDTAVLG